MQNFLDKWEAEFEKADYTALLETLYRLCVSIANELYDVNKQISTDLYFIARDINEVLEKWNGKKT
jgi:hypothetical protein